MDNLSIKTYLEALFSKQLTYHISVSNTGCLIFFSFTFIFLYIISWSPVSYIYRLSPSSAKAHPTIRLDKTVKTNHTHTPNVGAGFENDRCKFSISSLIFTIYLPAKFS